MCASGYTDTDTHTGGWEGWSLSASWESGGGVQQNVCTTKATSSTLGWAWVTASNGWTLPEHLAWPLASHTYLRLCLLSSPLSTFWCTSMETLILRFVCICLSQRPRAPRGCVLQQPLSKHRMNCDKKVTFDWQLWSQKLPNLLKKTNPEEEDTIPLFIFYYLFIYL